MSNVQPKIEIPSSLTLTRPGNPYRWVSFRNSDGTYTLPDVEKHEGNYLVTRNGESYSMMFIHGDTPLSNIIHPGFTHWFTKRVDLSKRMIPSWKPFAMDEGTEYLVNIQYHLRFINTKTMIPGKEPIILSWFDEKDLFPIL